MTYKTEQEKFWATEFGNKYIDRNSSHTLQAASLKLFTNILQKMDKINSAIELGPNIGLNLKSLEILVKDIKFCGVEINSKACDFLKMKFPKQEIINESILEYKSDKKYDLSFVRGVLIHINPNELQNIYQKLYDLSDKYILMAEYYSPSPVSIPYRGEADKLFKRDFASEFLDKFQDVELIDYGFLYHRDNNFPDDDINWFLMKKIIF